ncbi:MAG: septal ring lytic transglycosylase RlpA family protein [Hyphomicrobiales bacterium]|nr:septal ring lytic transglycosylase RlpA family protein [Hyphomicrobiales bacterium]
MRAYLMAAALVVAAATAAAAPAAAEDWWKDVIRQSSGVSEDARPARASATRSSRATRNAARSAERRARLAYDDGSRPQRRAAIQPRRAAASLSGGQVGIASYYWQGRLTANGSRYNPDGISAAHRTLPFGTRVRVTRLDTGRSVDVRINDRGPFIAGRIIDLSRGAARVIGMTGQGLARVQVSVLGR